MDKPFAITLDVGSSLANKTGSLAHRARRLRRPAAARATTPAPPARTSRAGSTTPRRAARLRARLAADHGGQPVPGRHGPRLLPPVRDRLQPRPARRGGRHQLGRALPRRRGDRAGLDGRAAAPSPPASACSSSAPGPSGLSAAYHLRRLGHDGRRSTTPGPMAGGMMRFGIPQATGCRATCSTPRSQRILDMGVTLELNTQGRRTSTTR